MRFIYTKTFTKTFTVFVIVALVVILDSTGYSGFFKNAFFHTYGFFQKLSIDTTNGLKNGFQTLFTIKKLARENAELTQKVNELSFDNARLKSARDENFTLRKALSFVQASELKLNPVESLTQDPTGFSQTITINKGTKDGISENQPVIAAPGFLVGKVSKLYSNSAEVSLITDPESAINAYSADSGARGIIRGEHGLSLFFDLLTQNELVKTGDSIMTSGLSGDYPRDLLIGQVSAIRSEKTDLFQKAYVTPAADLRSLRFLFVVE